MYKHITFTKKFYVSTNTKSKFFIKSIIMVYQNKLYFYNISLLLNILLRYLKNKQSIKFIINILSNIYNYIYLF